MARKANLGVHRSRRGLKVSSHGRGVWEKNHGSGSGASNHTKSSAERSCACDLREKHMAIGEAEENNTSSSSSGAGNAFQVNDKPKSAPRPAILEPSPGGPDRQPISHHSSREGSSEGSRGGSNSSHDEDMEGINEDMEIVSSNAFHNAKDNKYIPKPGYRWVVDWNSRGQAIGMGGHYLDRRIALIAKMGKYWPVDRHWKDVQHPSYRSTWNMLVRHFDLTKHKNNWNYIFSKLAERWRGWRCDLHRVYLRYKNDQRRLQYAPFRVVPQQWENLVRYWGTERAQRLSEINKKNRRKRKDNHRCGSRPLSRLAKKMQVEQNRESTPTPYEVYLEANKPMPLQAESAEHLTGMKEFVSKKTQQSGEDPINVEEIHSEAMSLHLGPKKADRMRGVGTGGMKTKKRRQSSYYIEENLLEENNELKGTVSQLMEVQKKTAEDNARLMEVQRKNAEDNARLVEENNNRMEENAKIMGMMVQLAAQMGVQDFDIGIAQASTSSQLPNMSS